MLNIEGAKMPHVVRKSHGAVTAIKMGDPKTVVAGCVSAAGIAAAAPLFRAREYSPREVPRNSIQEEPEEMDKSTDVFSVCSESTLDKTSDERLGSAKTNYFSFMSRRERRLIQEQENLKQKKLMQELAEEQEKARAKASGQARKKAVSEAVEFLEDFVLERWATNVSNGHVKIDCELTMEEVKGHGRLDQAEGTKKCGQLVMAPVIHDAIAHALWVELSERAALEDGDKKPDEAEMALDKLPDMAITKVPSEPVAKKNEKRKRVESITWDEGDIHRRTRSTRRATEGDVISAVRSRSAVPTSERNRRKSDRSFVRPDQVVCTTCGSRAMGSAAGDDEEAMKTDAEESGEKEGDTSLQSISRRISTKMSKKLTALGGGVASGYGGSRLIA